MEHTFVFLVALAWGCSGNADTFGDGQAAQGGNNQGGSDQGGDGAGGANQGGDHAGGSDQGGSNQGGNQEGGAHEGGGGNCGGSLSDYQEALAAAQACNACQGSDGCVNGPKLTDACGCEVHGNSAKRTEVAQAQALYAQLESEGCLPLDCTEPCPGGNSWSCQSLGGNDCDGSCQPF